jgi:hypothetical protein
MQTVIALSPLIVAVGPDSLPSQEDTTDPTAADRDEERSAETTPARTSFLTVLLRALSAWPV